MYNYEIDLNRLYTPRQKFWGLANFHRITKLYNENLALIGERIHEQYTILPSVYFKGWYAWAMQFCEYKDKVHMKIKIVVVPLFMETFLTDMYYSDPSQIDFPAFWKEEIWGSDPREYMLFDYKRLTQCVQKYPVKD